MRQDTYQIVETLFERYPQLRACRADILLALDMLVACFRAGGKLLLCGNGGSASDCKHIAAELLKGFCLRRSLPAGVKERLRALFPEEGSLLGERLQAGLPVISLASEEAVMTAIANDTDADLVFAQQLLALARKGDVLLMISTSGNSRNVCHAAMVGRLLDMRTILLSGRDGGKLKGLSDVSIVVPERETYRIQELHLPVYHALCLALENEFFKE